MPQFKTHNDASRHRGGEAARYAASYRASDEFDWDRAIVGFKRILAEVYGDDGT